jgi:transposase
MKIEEKLKKKFTQGMSTKTIANALDLKYCTVLKIINNYQKTGITKINLLDAINAQN